MPPGRSFPGPSHVMIAMVLKRSKAARGRQRPDSAHRDRVMSASSCDDVARISVRPVSGLASNAVEVPSGASSRAALLVFPCRNTVTCMRRTDSPTVAGAASELRRSDRSCAPTSRFTRRPVGRRAPHARLRVRLTHGGTRRKRSAGALDDGIVRWGDARPASAPAVS